MPMSMRKQALLAAGLGSALAGCLNSEARSDLTTDGNPRVVTVTILSEAGVLSDPYGMAATYCSNNADDKISAAYCPVDGAVADAWPLGWQAWVVFNELLLGDEVETIEENSGVLKPGIISLTCGGEEVTYGEGFSGWYDPSGSHLTLPVGPAIVITTAPSVAATGADCQISVANTVHDKDGNALSSDGGGPFDFKIAPMRLASEDLEGVTPTDPTNEATDVEASIAPTVSFNALVDAASAEGKVELIDVGTDAPVASTLSVSDASVTITPNAPLAPGTQYKIRVSSGIKDIKGGELTLDAPYESTFTTVAEMTN